MADVVVPAMVLTAGIVLLWRAGDRTVRYAIELADMYGIHSFTFGFIIVSVTTGLPEIMTVFVSIWESVEPLSAGNIIGSTFVNLSLVLGIATIAAGSLAIEREYEVSLLRVLGIMTVLTGAIILTSRLAMVHGVILIAAYAGAIIFLRRGGLIQKIVEEEEAEAEADREEEVILSGPFGTGIKLLVSLVLVLVGAELTVDASVTIGTMFGIGLEALGATVVAVGTGLPEITLELNAIKRREYALALGDIFGSSMVNLTLILGLLALLSPTDVQIAPLIGALTFLAGTIIFLWLVMIRNSGLERRHGIILIVFFLIYIIEEIGIVTMLA